MFEGNVVPVFFYIIVSFDVWRKGNVVPVFFYIIVSFDVWRKGNVFQYSSILLCRLMFEVKVMCSSILLYYCV